MESFTCSLLLCLLNNLESLGGSCIITSDVDILSDYWLRLMLGKPIEETPREG